MAQTQETEEKTRAGSQKQPVQVKQSDGAQGEQQKGVARREPFMPSLWTGSPFAFMRRFSEEMDRLFEDFDMGRGWLPSRFWRDREAGQALWSPEIEVFERDKHLIIRADLPGLTKDDIKVEFTDDGLTVQGERRQEHEETKEGYRHSERSYGSFYRSIPLPEGVSAENATASFHNGVLEISMPAPPRKEPQSRRIEIR
jgi:HSP20 family protein